MPGEGWTNLNTVAYSTLLASVADHQVIAFREGQRSNLEAGLSIHCSHLLTSWVQPDDLRGLLRQAIDGGQILRADLWHPFRVPIWHPSTSAIEIETKLRNAWNEQLEKAGAIDPSDWYVVEITKVVKVFEHAAVSHNGVVSFLEKPMDEERARRVLIPVVDHPHNESST
jgi:hypothetical protein